MHLASQRILLLIERLSLLCRWSCLSGYVESAIRYAPDFSVEQWLLLELR